MFARPQVSRTTSNEDVAQTLDEVGQLLASQQANSFRAMAYQRSADTVRRLELVVAPDLGAAKLADRYGRLLGCPVAVVQKTRLTGTEVSVQGVTGDVRGRRALVVDDMISTGATIEAAAARAALRAPRQAARWRQPMASSAVPLSSGSRRPGSSS